MRNENIIFCGDCQKVVDNSKLYSNKLNGPAYDS